MAQSKEILTKHGITHIINCSGDYSDNYFPKDFTYRRYFLKDSVRENIECIFYDAIEFINKAKDQGGRVLVHCVQGISRYSRLYIILLGLPPSASHI